MSKFAQNLDGVGGISTAASACALTTGVATGATLTITGSV